MERGREGGRERWRKGEREGGMGREKEVVFKNLFLVFSLLTTLESCHRSFKLFVIYYLFIQEKDELKA